MNLEQLACTVSNRLKLDNAAVYRIVREVFVVIKEEVLAGETLKVKGFGSFTLRLWKQKHFHNVSTGVLDIKPNHYKVKFIPSKTDFTPGL